MSDCLFWLRGLCLYIIIYLLQRTIQMVNYHLTARLYFVPFLLAPSQTLTNLLSSSCAPLYSLSTGWDRPMHTDSQRHTLQETL